MIAVGSESVKLGKNQGLRELFRFAKDFSDWHGPNKPFRSIPVGISADYREESVYVPGNARRRARGKEASNVDPSLRGPDARRQSRDVRIRRDRQRCR
jgi:hypothetical protein